MSAVRVVVGNQPRSYREALAAVLRLQRPDVVVVSVDPDEVDREVRKLEPGLVVASRQNRDDGYHPMVWLALYPGGRRLASVAVGGKPILLRDIDLASILCLVDWAKWLFTREQTGRTLGLSPALPGKPVQLLDDSVPEGEDHGLQTRMHLQLSKDVHDMGANRLGRDE